MDNDEQRDYEEERWQEEDYRRQCSDELATEGADDGIAGSSNIRWRHTPGGELALMLALSHPAAQRGTLYSDDGGRWGVVGPGYSRATAAKTAHRRGLVQDGFSGPAESSAGAVRRALGQSTPRDVHADTGGVL